VSLLFVNDHFEGKHKVVSGFYGQTQNNKQKKMEIVILVIIVLMIASAIAAAIFKDLMSAVIASCIVSLIAAVLFYFLQAPDVAMAEAAIGAALVTGVFVIAVKRTRRFEE
jgi:uncharacterized MnhB-related membrane protein